MVWRRANHWKTIWSKSNQTWSNVQEFRFVSSISKIFLTSHFFSFEKFEIIYVGETLIAFSNKEIRKIDIDSGQSEIDYELTKKFNVNGVTAYLGNGVSFVSSISSLNQQLEHEAAAASTSTPAG